MRREAERKNERSFEFFSSTDRKIIQHARSDKALISTPISIVAMKLPGPGFPYASFALVLAAQSLATATRPLDIGAKSDRHQLVAGGAVDFEDALVKTKTTSESSESNPGSALTAAPQKGTSNSGKGALQTGSKEGGLSAHQEEALPGPASRKKRAYATLLYSDFIHGTRALGQSLRESGTVADTVVLVTPDVRKETRDKLADDGWM